MVPSGKNEPPMHGTIWQKRTTHAWYHLAKTNHPKACCQQQLVSIQVRDAKRIEKKLILMNTFFLGVMCLCVSQPHKLAEFS
jgi:hypothetical protein